MKETKQAARTLVDRLILARKAGELKIPLDYSYLVGLNYRWELKDDKDEHANSIRWRERAYFEIFIGDQCFRSGEINVVQTAEQAYEFLVAGARAARDYLRKKSKRHFFVGYYQIGEKNGTNFQKLLKTR